MSVKAFVDCKFGTAELDVMQHLPKYETLQLPMLGQLLLAKIY